MHHRPLETPRAIAVALPIVVVLLWVSSAAFAADPTPKVKPRPGAKARPAPLAGDSRDPNDRGGVGPRNDGSRKPGDRPEGRELSTFAAGSPEAVVRAAFACALDRGESSGFDCYAALNVSSNRDNSTALTHLRRYQWSHFRKWAPTYPLPGKDFRLLLTQQTPEKLDDKAREVRLYLWSNQRDNPAPITLRREGGRWLIHANSL